MLSDFVRTREESRTNTALIDPTTGIQTEINERGPHVSEQEIELFADKLLYLAKGASLCVFAGSLPARGRRRHLRPADQGGPAARRRRPSSTRTGTRCAAPCAPSPTSSRRTCSRPRSSSGHEFNDDEDHLFAVREMVELGAREAIMTAPDGCSRRCFPEERAARSALPGADLRGRGGDARRSAPATRSSPATSPRATAGASAAECLAYGVACGAESTAAPRGGCGSRAGRAPAAEVEVELRSAAEVG